MARIGISKLKRQRKSFCSVKIHRLSRMKCSMLWQKSRSKWIREGDTNSKYFHGCINIRRRGNEILYLNFNGRQVDEVNKMKSVVKNHFQTHFQARDEDMPIL